MAATLEVWEQQRVLQQQADPAIVGRDEHARCGIGQHTIPDADVPSVRPHQARDHVQGGRFARTVGPEHSEDFACGDGEFDVDATAVDDGAQR